MKLFLVIILAGLFFAQTLFAEPPGKLAARIGTTFWSPPEKHLVRATVFKKGKGKSDGKSGLRYATAKVTGTLATPRWLPRGSLVTIRTETGVLSYIAADGGGGVESRRAAKSSGKTKEQKAAAVLDFCAEKQLWPDFVTVEIHYYAGKIAFNELSSEEQKTLFAYSRDYLASAE